jgi:hypothetical protein
VDATITGASIVGSTITGGTINVTSDIYVGNNVYLNGSGLLDKKIVFGPTTAFTAQITSTSVSGNALFLEAPGGVFVGGDAVATQSWVSAQLSGKSNVGHTHSVTISSHNHGLPDPTNLATSSGGTVTHSSSGGGTYTTSS